MHLFGGRTGIGIRLRVSKKDCMNLVLSLLRRRRTHFEIHFLKVFDVRELNDLLKVVLNGLNLLVAFLILKIKCFLNRLTLIPGFIACRFPSPVPLSIP